MSAKRMNGKLRVDQINSRVIIWTRVGDTMDQNGSWLLLSECMWFNVPFDTNRSFHRRVFPGSQLHWY